MIINHNMNAMNAHRNMAANNVSSGKAMEKLSSGLRINRAGDDAAGLAISEKMRGQIRGLDQASRNAQDGISLIQTAEGALNETHSILQRMRELAVQGGNDTLAAQDRDSIATEMGQLEKEVDRIADTTQFNGKTILKGTFGNSVDSSSDSLAVAGVIGATAENAKAATTFTFDGSVAGKLTLADTDGNAQTLDFTAAAAGTQKTYNFDKLGLSITVDSNVAAESALTGKEIVTNAAPVDGGVLQVGANSGQTMGIQIGNMGATALGVNGLSVSDNATINTAGTGTLAKIDDAITTVSNERSKLGAYQNRLEHTIANLGTSSENLTSAESRIRDVDMAKEMMNFSKNNILSQAAQAMLAQANQQPQGVLQLLR